MTVNATRLGRLAREALLLIRQFMGKGDFHRAAEAALKAAEIFKEIAKHSSGSAHRVAVKRAKILIEITKVLRRGESLPLELVEELDTFYPAPAPTPPVQPPKLAPSLQPKPSEEGATETPETGEEVELTKESDTHHELLNGLAIACKITEMLDRATQSIRIMVQNLTDVKTIKVGTDECEVNLIERLASKAEQGVLVRLIVREPEAFGGLSDHFRQALEKLLQKSPKVEVLVCTHIHIKALIVDEAEVLEGSANFTAKGLSGIGEQATWTSNSTFIEKFIERFDEYWVHQSNECTACKNRTCEVHPLTRRV